jgi:hypothetical protein
VDSDTYSRNEEVAARLWKVSEEMAGIAYLSDETSEKENIPKD